MTARVHVDTDVAGDPDDACALAMLLGSDDAEVVAATTALEDGGRRHDCLRALLAMANRADVETAAGLGQTLTRQRFRCTWDDARHWPVTPPRTASSAGAALDLLARSIDAGAAVLAIGGFTNLAALELARPGSLAGVPVIAMAGWLDDPAAGWPRWGAALDFNTQCDTVAAEIVAGAGAALTLVTLPVAMQATLRGEHLDRLRASGPIGRLLARQSEVHRDTSGFGDLARVHAALPDDLVNFHWDPVAAAVAIGWDCVTIRATRVSASTVDGVVCFAASADAGPDGVTVALDESGFSERWIGCIERVDRLARQGR